MRSVGWTLIICDWCPYQERKFGHGPAQTGVKTQGEHGHPKETGLEHQPYKISDMSARPFPIIGALTS